MMKKLIAFLPLTLALAACGSLNPKNVEQETDYICENGATIRAAEGGDKVKLTVLNIAGNPSAVLHRAPSASGELFANNDGFFRQPSEWHRKGDQTILSYSSNGQEIETKCQVKQ